MVPTAKQVVRGAHGQVATMERSIGRHSLRSRKLFAVLALASLALVQACREEEQDRPLVYEKGTYQGKADEKLNQDQIEALRQRAAGQQM